MNKTTKIRFIAAGFVLALIVGLAALNAPQSTNVAAQDSSTTTTNEPRNLVSNLNTSTDNVRLLEQYLVGNQPVSVSDADTTVRHPTREMSVPFTTGPNVRGYYINSITLHLWTGESAAGYHPVVEIWDDRSTYARQRVATLTTPDPISIPAELHQNERFTFTAPPGSGIHVDPNTTYHIRVHDGVGDTTTVSYFFWGVTDSNEQDDSDDRGNDPSGWAIGNHLNYRYRPDVTWYGDGFLRTARFAIRGTNVTDEHAVLIDGTRSVEGLQRRMDTREGETTTYDVWLSSAPSEDVTVGVSTTSDLITVEPSTLTFSATNFANVQKVSVTSREDTDALDNDAVIEHTVTGYSDVDSVPPMNVSIHDDDTIGRFDVRLEGRAFVDGALGLTEGGEAGIYVAPEISSDQFIEVTATSSNPNVVVSPTSWWWDVNSLEEKLFHVTAPRDSNGSPERATITLSSRESNAGTLYQLPDFKDIEVYVNDLDAIEFNEGVEGDLLSLDEGGTKTVVMTLAEPLAEPITDDVTLTVEIDPRLDMTHSPASIVFTGGINGNWSRPRTMYFVAGTDEDGISETGWVRMRLTGDKFGGGIVNGEAFDGDILTLRAAVDDNDKQSLESNLPTDVYYDWLITLREGEESSFTMRLTSQPSPAEDVTMTFTRIVGDAGVEFRSPDQTEWSETSVLTFTTANWSADQTMSIRALQDAGIRDAAFRFRIEGNGADYDDNGGALKVTVIDDDVAELIPSTNVIDMNETHELAQSYYSVHLASQPEQEVRVTISTSSNYLEVDTDPLTPGAQNTLVFEPDNWHDVRRVDVTLHPDHDIDDTRIVIMHRASGFDYDTVTLDVTVEVDDQFECPPER